MPRYEVAVYTGGTVATEVQAANEDEARAIAEVYLRENAITAMEEGVWRVREIES